MFYEVVDPDNRRERGVTYASLTDAMVNAGPTLEVWELADDEAQTRMVMCWPDPEFQPASELERQRIKRFVREQVGRAEREASAILAEHHPVSPDKVHALVSLAWAKGFLAGYGSGSEAVARMVGVLAGGDPK